MKTLSEKHAVLKLRRSRADFRHLIEENYEKRAKSCRTCDVRGACCLDAHFVNVHITRLDAVLIREELEKLPAEKQNETRNRITAAIDKYGLSANAESFDKTYACPLFDKDAGCLVHTVKPVACILHACYEREEDLPPDQFQEAAETAVEELNRRTYRKFPEWRPLPVWLDGGEAS